MSCCVPFFQARAFFRSACSRRISVCVFFSSLVYFSVSVSVSVSVFSNWKMLFAGFSVLRLQVLRRTTVVCQWIIKPFSGEIEILFHKKEKHFVIKLDKTLLFLSQILRNKLKVKFVICFREKASFRVSSKYEFLWRHFLIDFLHLTEGKIEVFIVKYLFI
jgi:hypothetical protein